MSKAQDLAAALAKVGNDAIARWVASDAEAMAAVAAKVEQRSATLANRRQPQAFHKRLVEAIGRFRRNPDSEFDFRTLRLVCHGCSHGISEGSYALLADSRAFPVLLGSVYGYAHEPRRFRRLYHGLLQSYLATDRNVDWFNTQEARLGNEQLRQFLDGCFHSIRDLEPPLPWVEALADHCDILSERPTDRLVRLWHTGTQDAFRDVIARLGIGGSSWLVAATLTDVVAAAAKQDDFAFVAQIPSLLELICEQRFQSLRDDILVALVTRYAHVANPTVHPALRDALIDAWKNPWLERNQSAWGRVPDAARKMVAGWLKLDLIHQFFEVLSEDRGQDHQRFEFWRDYYEEMDDVYFALGSRAFNSRDSDIVKLRESLDGRLLQLGGAEPANNAFIMFIGESVFIEFSKKGNAAYRYHSRDFDLTDGNTRIHIKRLKRSPPGMQMRHDWSGGKSWQDQFAAFIAQRSPAEILRRHGHPSSPFPQIKDIKTYASKHGIRVHDKRSLGGSLWLRTDDADPDITKTLTAWGFRFAPGKGWWRTNP